LHVGLVHSDRRNLTSQIPTVPATDITFGPRSLSKASVRQELGGNIWRYFRCACESLEPGFPRFLPAAGTKTTAQQPLLDRQPQFNLFHVNTTVQTQNCAVARRKLQSHRSSSSQSGDRTPIRINRPAGRPLQPKKPPSPWHASWSPPTHQSSLPTSSLTNHLSRDSLNL
jgi:hypothetical protein